MAKAELELKVDTGVYPLAAVQAAAYTFTDRAHVRISRRGGHWVRLLLKQKPGASELRETVDDFYNELLHETLRHQVSAANQKIREFIVTKALVSAQVPSLPPSEDLSDSCPECAAEARAEARGAGRQAAQPVDAELEKEIDKLLKEIEGSGPGTEDPLGVTVPWEKKYGAQRPGAAKSAKPARAKMRLEKAKRAP